MAISELRPENGGRQARDTQKPDQRKERDFADDVHFAGFLRRSRREDALAFDGSAHRSGVATVADTGANQPGDAGDGGKYRALGGRKNTKHGGSERVELSG